jgi:hypothetical protein
MMLFPRGKPVDIPGLLRDQWMGRPLPPAPLLEQRILEMEGMGLEDDEPMPGVPSTMRQFAIASLQGERANFFVTFDDDLLDRRDILEGRYGMKILSVQEAAMLLQETDGPPN